MFRLQPLKHRQTPARRRARLAKRTRRAALRPVRAAGFDVPADAFKAAIADGYDPAKLGSEIADSITNTQKQLQRAVMLRALWFVGAGLAIGAALAGALAWLVL